MKNLYNTLFKSSNIVKNCICTTLMLCISFVAVSANAKIKDKEKKTTVLTSVAANTEYNFSGDVKLNKVTLDNTILNIADGKELTLNNNVSVKGENSTINASTINLGSKTLTVSDDAKLTLSGSVESKGNGGGINLGNSGTLGVESGKTLNLGKITLSSGIVDLAGKIVGNLKETTLNLTDKNADFSGVAFDNVDFKISTTDYDITNNIEMLLGINGITDINLANSAPLEVDTELNLGQKTLSGGVVDLAGTIIGNLKDTTLNITDSNVDFSEATFKNVNFKVSDKGYDFYSLLNEENVKWLEGITTLTLADAEFKASDMETISQKFSGKVDNLSFEKGTYNITESIGFNNDTLSLTGGTFEITNADLESSNNFSITGGTFEITNADLESSNNFSITGGSITATSESRDNGIWVTNLLSVSGGNITADGFEFSGHGGVEISGGTLNLGNDSEIASNLDSDMETSGTIPYITISGGDITLNRSHLLSRSDIETKGIINITGGDLTVNEGFMGAFNYSDGGLDNSHDSEGGDINISGGTITFNGGNSIDDPVDWVGDEDGYFIANEILAQNINVGGDAQINISKNANLKTTVLTRTDGDSIDFADGASLIKLSDNSTLNLSGALRGNIDRGIETAGTLNINDSDARIVGNVSGVNLAINSEFDIDNIEGNIGQLGNLDITEGGLTISGGKKIAVDNLTIGGGESYLKGEGLLFQNLQTSEIQVNGAANIVDGILKIDSLVGLVAKGSEDINVLGGQVIGENSWNTPEEIQDDDTRMGNNIRHDGSGNINVLSGEVNFKDHASIVTRNGDVNISGGKVILSNGAEIWSANEEAKTVISGNADITITSGADITPEGTLEIKGGKIDVTDGEVAGITAFNMTGGTLNLNNGMFGAEGPEVEQGNDSIHKEGQVMISGGTINVAGIPSIATHGTITEDDHVNILSGGDITMNGGVMNIQDGALLSVRNGFDDETYGDTSTIQFTGGTINLFGTLDGDLIGNQYDARHSGTLNIMSENADITGIAHWLNIGLQADSTFMGEDIFIHNLTVGDDDQKAVQLVIDGDSRYGERAWGIIDSLTVKDGATALAKTTTAEWEQTGELDSPVRHNVALNISKVQVDKGAILELNGNGNHSVDVFDVKTAIINGTLNLINGRLEGSDEDPSSTISIDGADIHMSGISNIEAGGAITIHNSSLDMDIDDHGIVSSTSLDIQGSSITFLGNNLEEFGNGHLIAYKGFHKASGYLNIGDGSVINMMGANLLSGEKVAISDSELNIQGNSYIISHQNEIDVQNSSLTIGNEKTLSVLTGKDLAEIDDEEYPTIVAAYQALNPKYGVLNMQDSSTLNLAGTLYSDAYIDNGTLTISSKNASIHGTTALSNSSVLNLGTNKLTTDTLNIGSGTTVNFTIAGADDYGSIKANKAFISSKNTTLNLTVNNGVVNYDDPTGITVQLIDANKYNGSFETLNEVNNRYGFKDLGNGNYQIYGLGNSAASIVASVGGSSETQAAATAWLDTENSEANTGVLNHLETLAQVNASGFTKAIETLQPEAASVRVETTTSNNLQIANATTTRLNNLANIEAIGRSAGDTALQSNLWAQGLHNKSKLDRANGFSGKTYGIAMGFDAKPSDDTIVGFGYAYTQTDLDAIQKDTDIESHTAMVYGQQTIYNAFINAIVTYGFNKYDETKADSGIHISADYDMDSVFTQIITGYNFNLASLKITPKMGLRYLWTHTHNYTDFMDQHVRSKNTNTLTGIVGTTFAADFNVQGFTFTPKITLAGTYDLKQDGGSSTVTLANGANYTTRGDTLKRFGVESGIGLNMSYKDFEFGIQYEGRFKKDYKDHTGMINFRYNF